MFYGRIDVYCVICGHEKRVDYQQDGGGIVQEGQHPSVLSGYVNANILRCYCSNCGVMYHPESGA